uniref:tail fiber assembly protein n=1 Tax=Citrobacter amalonaticus TaxID=35703 RepID=UPI001E5B391A
NTMTFFSPTTCGFYAAELKENFVASGTWPADAVEISAAEYDEFKSPPPSGKMLGAADGMPVWVNAPAKTQAELVAEAEQARQQLIDSAMSSISVIQLKLQAGRTLTEEETIKLNAVLDYIDAVNAVDTATAPDVSWPDLAL